MKSFLISIRPKWVGKTLNGEKTIEIRRDAPKDWKDYLSGKTKIKPEPKTGYIYCTKGNRFLFKDKSGEYFLSRCLVGSLPPLNAQVVAKFTLREVELIYWGQDPDMYDECVLETDSLDDYELEQRSCLKIDELQNYIGYELENYGYAWHISDLVIFDKPKELSAFMKPNWDKGLDKALEQARKEDEKIAERIYNGDASEDEIANCEELTLLGFKLSGAVTRAPQSWRYVEELL